MEERYCSYCGHRLEPEARFCSNCGRPVHRATSEPSPQEEEEEEQEASTTQLPTSSPPPPPQQQLPPQTQVEVSSAPALSPQRSGGTRLRWLPMAALVGILLIVVVVETMQGMLREAIAVIVVVAVVVLIGSGISYLSLSRRGQATIGGALLNWSVVALAGFTAFLFLIS